MVISLALAGIHSLFRHHFIFTAQIRTPRPLGRGRWDGDQSYPHKTLMPS